MNSEFYPPAFEPKKNFCSATSPTFTKHKNKIAHSKTYTSCLKYESFMNMAETTQAIPVVEVCS